MHAALYWLWRENAKREKQILIKAPSFPKQQKGESPVSKECQKPAACETNAVFQIKLMALSYFNLIFLIEETRFLSAPFFNQS